MATSPEDHMQEIRQRVFDLYIELFDRSREPTLKDIARVVYILRLMQRAGSFDVRRQYPGALGSLAEAIGVTPGMLWISIVLCGILVGKPFFDFIKAVLPFAG